MKKEVITYICLERCRPVICGTLYWAWNLIQETWFHDAWRQGIFLCHLGTPSQPDSSPVALTCCPRNMLWDCRDSNTCIKVRLWDLAWIFHVCLTESILFNQYVMGEVETEMFPWAHLGCKWPWKCSQPCWFLRAAAPHFSRFNSLLGVGGCKIGQACDVWEFKVCPHHPFKFWSPEMPSK